MKVAAAFCFWVMALSAFPSFAQYDDVPNLPDAPTRTAEQPGVRCTLEGVQVAKRDWENGVKNISVAFILSRKPLVYFHYYDAKKKAVVFDFYDTHIGDSPLDSISEAPITGSSVEFFSLDLNKKIPGLKPDFRDVVRVSIYVPAPIDYDVQEDEALITMSFKAPGEVKGGSLRQASPAPFWQLPLAVLVAGAVGFTAYMLFLK